METTPRQAKIGYRPILRFATFAAAVFVLVFTLTWFALAQDGPKAAAQPPGKAEVEVNLGALGALGALEPTTAPSVARPSPVARPLPLARPPGPARVEVPASKKITLPKKITAAKEIPVRAPAIPVATALPLVPPLPSLPGDRSPPPPPPIPTSGSAAVDTLAAAAARAVRPTSGAGLNDRQFRLLFDEGSPALTFEAAGELEAVAVRLTGNAIRVDVHAYAGRPDNSSSDNHNLSLKRALAVRGYLVEQGIPARRIDLHMEGSAADRAPPERVDIRFRGTGQQANQQD